MATTLKQHSKELAEGQSAFKAPQVLDEDCEEFFSEFCKQHPQQALSVVLRTILDIERTKWNTEDLILLDNETINIIHTRIFRALLERIPKVMKEQAETFARPAGERKTSREYYKNYRKKRLLKGRPLQNKY